jgi:hypothetical protein
MIRSSHFWAFIGELQESGIDQLSITHLNFTRGQSRGRPSKRGLAAPGVQKAFVL